MTAATQVKLSRQPDDDLYLAARQEYSDRYANLAAGKRNWQMAAFSAFGIAAMCGVVAIIQVRKPAEVPYVVMLDRSDGYAVTFPTPPTASALNRFKPSRATNRGRVYSQRAGGSSRC